MQRAATYEFHVSRAARNRYQFTEGLFSQTGGVVFANPRGAQEFAESINKVRGTAPAARAGDLYAMGLIDEALHLLIGIFRRRIDPRVVLDSLVWFEERAGRARLDATLLAFAEHFPMIAVYRGDLSAAAWLAGGTAGVSHRAVAMEELLMLWLANANPAFRPYVELFDDTLLSGTEYRAIGEGFPEFFATRPRFGRRGQTLYDVLCAPALAAPESLAGQLAFLREEWGDELADLMRLLLTAEDILKEEERAVWMAHHPGAAMFDGGDSSAAAVPSFFGKEHEYEAFSQDVHWMPSTVMLAKTVYVWLDQLSKHYRRDIYRLDHVPDEELDQMRRRGFNALWLIGIWERSKASRRIKQMTGNPEAVASAYSLYDYTIASDLGGDAAYRNLRDRAWARGIRLASDMVPNHMAIDSRWVIEHPDWFLSLPYSPYPAYSFNGEDLSEDGRVEIKVEDHYYNRSDAAVVFQRRDRWSGETRYIYHGNDGTSFPWNDTAQLNYLNPEVREAVIQTILHVARHFPIIRFDAAMTLTKQHYQRLWFPQPGTGGAIPSRAEQGMTKQEFDRAMPAEFWREVVDRVAAEAPDTLLLAEAFWLLEGYFVRTLGMHRVYNSAFMNMLRDEENANYRSVLKNTLEFDPEVLKRYVNFMNNPDERTAVDQFGKGDKYFGVCVLLATLPGLPMFGHGQVEGFAERYGMEYRKAYRDERPDEWLIGRFEREIAPLLHRRPLFAEVRNFQLYDFFADAGHVNEDVFAYSNRLDGQRALIVYNNRWTNTSGWVRTSCGFMEKSPDGRKRNIQRALGDSLGLRGEHDWLVAFRDFNSGHEYLYRAADVRDRGLRFELGAFQYRVLLDWRDIRADGTRPWDELCDQLHGRGVPSLEDALRVLELKPLHGALRNLLELPPALVSKSPSKKGAKKPGKGTPQPVPTPPAADLWAQLGGEPVRLTERAGGFFDLVKNVARREVANNPQSRLKSEGEWRAETAQGTFTALLKATLHVPAVERAFSAPWSAEARAVLPNASATRAAAAPTWGCVLAWALLESAARAAAPSDPESYALALFDEGRLRQPVAEALEKLGVQGEDRWRASARLRFAFAHPWALYGARRAETTPAPYAWLHDPDVMWLLGVHEHEGVRYFNKESFEQLLWWTALRPLIEIASKKSVDSARAAEVERDLNERFRAAAAAEYRVESLLEQSGVL